MVKDKEVKRKRAEFKDKRLVDSGVWMGSDDSRASILASEDAPPCWGEELLGQNQNLNRDQERDREQDQDEGMGMGMDMGVAMSTTAGLNRIPARPGFAKKVEESREHQMARAVVNDCLESGLDSVDIRYGGILKLSCCCNDSNKTAMAIYALFHLACSDLSSTSPSSHP